MRHKFISRSGFTIIEVSIALVLVSLIMLCVMSLFEAMGTTVVSSTATMFANADSSKAMQHIIGDAREASTVALPDDASTTFAPFGNTQFTNFETTFSGSNVDTGIEITYPAGATAPTVALSSGTKTIAIYNRQVCGALLFIYRADPNGTPDPAAGSCLWEYGVDNGNQVNQALISSIAMVPNAVQFSRPLLENTIQTYAVEIKIISGYYSPTYGTNTNESTNGQVATTLTGKCVLLRDQYTGTNPQNVPTSPTNSTGPHWSPG